MELPLAGNHRGRRRQQEHRRAVATSSAKLARHPTEADQNTATARAGQAHRDGAAHSGVRYDSIAGRAGTPPLPRRLLREQPL
jgi:hypothetical protein